MTKKEINIFDYAGEIFKALPKGIILTSEAEDCINAMTIGWGNIGIEWGVPTFVAYIRKSRFTYELIERTGEFTICVPYGEEKNSAQVNKIIGVCGSQSGRDLDKLAKVGAHIVDADEIRPPAIKELPLTIECRVVLSVEQPVNYIPQKFRNFYPEIPSMSDEKIFDPHVAYFGEILKSYIIEE